MLEPFRWMCSVAEVARDMMMDLASRFRWPGGLCTEAHIHPCPLEHHGAYAFRVNACVLVNLSQSSEAPPVDEIRGSAAESVKSFISGGFGGVAAVLVGKPLSVLVDQWSSTTLAGHPFDLTKTRIQTAAPGVYTGALDVVKKTLARDGITGCVMSTSSGIFVVLTCKDSMYRGMVPPLLGVTPIFAVSFWVGYPCITCNT
jgi:hypothetical protein